MSELSIIIGERLRVYRIRARFSQEELAERADLHASYIGQVERGEKNATIESITKIARALRLPLEILFANVVTSETDNVIAAECYQEICLLDKKQQQLMLDIIKKISEIKNT